MESEGTSKVYVICNVCGENLGIDRPNWGVEHLKKFPTHRSYREMRLKSDQKAVSSSSEEL